MQRGNFVLGMVVGLLIGLTLALGVALYITKAPSVFINKVPQRTSEQDAAEAAKNKTWDPNAPLAGKASARGVPAPANAATGSVAGVPAPVTAAAIPASQARSGARDTAALRAGQSSSSSTPRSTAAGADSFTYYVQAGAYARAEDAEQQRAKLALLGFGAKVMEREQSGRAVFRVRVGPFDRRDDAEAEQTRLAAASFETNLVRVER